MRLSTKFFATGAILSALMIVAACSGGTSQTVPANGNAIAPNSVTHATVAASPTLTPPPYSGTALSTKYAYYDKNHVYHYAVINGVDNKFAPYQVGDTPSGAHGDIGSSFDGVGCYQTMSYNYHIHVFVGLYVNGTEYAIPRGMGVSDPKSPAPTILYATRCFYSIHSHDETGIIHVEDPNNGVVEKPAISTKYTSGQLFNIYGITVTANNFGPFNGPVEIFYSGSQYRHIDPRAGGIIPESTLSQWTGDPNAIPLYDHQVIWFLVGPNYPASLPSINFAGGY